jgi:hypothetical protein
MKSHRKSQSSDLYLQKKTANRYDNEQDGSLVKHPLDDRRSRKTVSKTASPIFASVKKADVIDKLQMPQAKIADPKLRSAIAPQRHIDSPRTSPGHSSSRALQTHRKQPNIFKMDL